MKRRNTAGNVHWIERYGLDLHEDFSAFQFWKWGVVFENKSLRG
jgi:hypothetical protein